MPVTAQQTQLVRRIDTHVRHVLAQGCGDDALLVSMADYIGTFKQLLDTCLHRRRHGRTLRALRRLLPLCQAARAAGRGYRRWQRRLLVA
jgi:hypothetical protein